MKRICGRMMSSQDWRLHRALRLAQCRTVPFCGMLLTWVSSPAEHRMSRRKRQALRRHEKAEACRFRERMAYWRAEWTDQAVTFTRFPSSTDALDLPGSFSRFTPPTQVLESPRVLISRNAD